MVCPSCGKEVEQHQAYCHHCGEKISPSEALSGEQHETMAIPAWEDRDKLGFFNGLFLTLKEVLLSPAAFFKKMPVRGGVTNPLLYALIIGMAGLIFSYTWNIMFPGAMKTFMAGDASWGEAPRLGGQGLLIAAILTPFSLIAWMFVTTGILHLILLVIRGAGAGFEATFRVIAYSVSPYFFTAIPFCGNLIAPLWSLVLVVIGLKEAHRTTGGKALFAVFFPVIFICGLAITVFALFMGAIIAFLGGLSVR